jgi:tRNA(adenine34) deaminase
MQYDPRFMEAAFEAAAQSEANGNLPIGAVITDGMKVLAVGLNEVMTPSFHPARHAEIHAFNDLEEAFIPRLAELGLYVTLEPCVMCLGSAVLHRIKAIFFATADPHRGASYLIPHIGLRYPKSYLPTVHGPMMQERGEPLFMRANEKYRKVRPAS